MNHRYIEIELPRENDDGSETLLLVTTVFHPGTRGSWDEPPCGAEVEITQARTPDGTVVDLTPDEVGAVEMEVFETLVGEAADSGSDLRFEE